MSRIFQSLVIVFCIFFIVTPLKAQNTLPWYEGFENTTAKSVASNTSYINGLSNVQFNTNNMGRLYFTPGQDFYRTGSRSGTFDVFMANIPAGKSSNSLVFTHDLSDYDSSQLKLSFWYLNGNANSDSMNKVWIRGNDTFNWIAVCNTDINRTAGWQKVEVDIDSILRVNNQDVGSNFQLRFTQVLEYDKNEPNEFSIDDISIVEELGNNAGILSIEPSCVGTSPVNVVLSNVGNNTIAKGKISWSINGVQQPSAVFNSNILPGEKASVFIGNHTFSKAINDTFKIYIDSVNGTLDSSRYNDTLEVIIDKPSSMSGLYTVGSSGADFTSVDMAIDSLRINGMCGPVTIRVKPGVYKEQVILNPIRGASKENTIRIVGAGADSTVLTSSANFTLTFRYASFYTIDSLAIKNTNTNGGRVIWVERNSNYNAVTNCNISADLVNPTINRSVIAGVHISGSSTGGDGHQRTIRNFKLIGNKISGGYYGLYIRGYSKSKPANTRFWIQHNEFYNQLAYSIYYMHCHGMRIIGNTIDSLAHDDGIGIYSRENAADSLCGNTVFTPNYGMFFLRANQDWDYDTSYVMNNMMSGQQNGKSNTIYGDRIKQMHFLGNSLFSRSPRVTLSNSTMLFETTLYKESVSDLKIQNNIIVSQNSFPVYATIRDLRNGYIDHNNYYSINGSYLARLNGEGYKTIADWQQDDSTQNQHSLSVNPEFFGDRDLHTISYNLNNKGKNLSVLKSDFDGESRPIKLDSTYDIGADEYYIYPWDADIVDIENKYLTRGNNTIGVVIENYGTKTWNSDSIFVEYAIDSAAAVKDTIVTGIVKPDSTVQFSFTLPYYLIGKAKKRKVCIRFTKPFRGEDPDALGDVFCDSICSEFINPVITVGSSGADFKKLSYAINHLSCSGLSQPTTIRVARDSIHDFVKMGFIRGASYRNTVTIVGAGQSSVVTNNSKVTKTTFKLNGAKHFIFDSLMLETTAADGEVFIFENYSDSNVVKNSTLKSKGANNSGYIIEAFGERNGSFNTFENNRLEGGSGVYWVCSPQKRDQHNSFINNVFRNQNGIVFYSGRNRHQYFVGNDIDSVNQNIAYGFYIFESEGDSVASNRVVVEGHGVYLADFDSGYVVNNMISGSSNQNVHSLYYYGVNTYVIGNSIWNKSKTTNHVSAAAFRLEGTGIIKNNCIYREFEGFAFSKSAVDPGEMDYNNFYAPNSTNFIYAWSNHSSLASYVNVSRKDSHSISVNPRYFDFGDLRTKARQLDNTGYNENKFAKDFYGNKRPAQGDKNFDIGAYEFAIIEYDADIVDVAPRSFKYGENKIRVTVKNDGIKTWFNDQISLAYTVDSGVVVEQSFKTGTVLRRDTVSFVFDTPFRPDTVTTGNGYQLCATITKRFRNSDPDRLREHFCKSLCLDEKKSVISVGKLNANFETLNEAFEYLECSGISKPLTIRLQKGLYQGQINVPFISGVSDTTQIRIVGQSDSTILSHNGKQGLHTLKLGNVSYFTFDSLTIQTTSNADGRAVYFANNSKHNSITNCKLIASKSTNSLNNAAVVASGSDYKLTETKNVNNNKVQNNQIIGGYYGVVFMGNTGQKMLEGNEFAVNVFFEQHKFGASFTNVAHTQFTNNEIKGLKRNDALALSFQDGAANHIIANSINSTAQAISIKGENSSGVDTSVIANNFLIASGSQSAKAALEVNNSRYIDILHNSVLVTDSTSLSAATSLLNIENGAVANNIFMSLGKGEAIIESSGIYLKGMFDYNDYYAPRAKNLAQINGVQTDLAQIKSISVDQNQHSISDQPYFTSIDDLHAGAVSLMASGGSFGVAHDKDGDKRSNTNPDIGADEIRKDIKIVEVLGPLDSCRKIGNLDSIAIVIRNEGPSIVYSADSLKVNSDVNGAKDYEWLNMPNAFVLKPMDEIRIALNNPIEFISEGKQDLTIHTEYSRDTNKNNDVVLYEFSSYLQPIAKFDFTGFCEKDTIFFLNESEDAAQFKWEFGDNNSNTAQNPTHIYGAYGTYNVVLEATSKYECTDKDSLSITILKSPSLPEWTYSNLTGLTFNFEVGSQVDTSLSSFIWSFGDGATARGAVATHTFAAEGGYNITCTSTNASSCSSIVSKNKSIKINSVSELNRSFGLNAYPNPFSKQLTLSYVINEPAQVKLELVDMHGRVVNTLVNSKLGAGIHDYQLKNELGLLAAGVHIARLSVDDEVVFVVLNRVK
ncbi:MAG: PKD domain-containing protein [Bacteroidia bacterium]